MRKRKRGGGLGHVDYGRGRAGTKKEGKCRLRMQPDAKGEGPKNEARESPGIGTGAGSQDKPQIKVHGRAMGAATTKKWQQAKSTPTAHHAGVKYITEN